MEKNKVINFQNHPKKELHLTGYLSLPLRVGEHLSLPLRVGERAWIISNSGIHPTSEVEKIWEVSESGVLFETKNIIYRLNYITANAKTGVICA